MCTRYLVLAVMLATGCATLMGGHKPGVVRKDVVDGWQLSGIMVPIGGTKVVRVDIGQIRATQDVNVTLLLNTADDPIDCTTITFVAAEPVNLTKVRVLPAGPSSQAASGQLPLASLAAAAKPGLKLDWCQLEIPLDSAQIARLQEFADKAGT